MRKFLALIFSFAFFTIVSGAQAQTTPTLPQQAKDQIGNNAGTQEAKGNIASGEQKGAEASGQDIQAPGEAVLDSAQE